MANGDTWDRRLTYCARPARVYHRHHGIGREEHDALIRDRVEWIAGSSEPMISDVKTEPPRRLHEN
jgi:hypothetical protein